VKQFRSSLKDNSDDIHASLMSRYQEAPEWWYVYELFIKSEKRWNIFDLGILFYLLLRSFLLLLFAILVN
jgi:hypothetical protein